MIMIRSTLFLLAIITFLSTISCVKEECVTTYTFRSYEPVFKTVAEINKDIVFIEDRALENPGKFFYYQNLILINERGSGVHIIDNSNLNAPKKLGFIAIEGNEDISLSDHYIYADTWQNILVIDIADYRNPTVVDIINGVKDEIWEVDRGLFLVAYEESTETLSVSCEEYNGPVFFINNRLMVDVNFGPESAFSGSQNLDANSGGQGQAGSLTRMALFNDHFYYINNHTMHVFDVQKLDQPDKLNEVFMEWGIETIFPYEDKLFIGANNGMHIFDNSVPSDPKYLSTFAHANACDPVVVQGDLAYVTLRNGNDCQNFTNELNVVDVSDILKPQLLASFPMHNPHGLSVRDNILYLCEADEGLKIFDISEPEEIHKNQIGQIPDYFAFDVISVSSGLLLMIGEDGFYQFNTVNNSDPKLLSSIKVGE